MICLSAKKSRLPNSGGLLVNAMEPEAKHAVHASAFFCALRCQTKMS